MLLEGSDLTRIHEMAEKSFEASPHLKLEYFEIANSDTLLPAQSLDRSNKYRAFIAAFAGPVRLIDNIAFN